MRIAFLNVGNADFNAATPFTQPLGGTESAACFLAAALARLGHQPLILSKTSAPGLHRGVECVRWDHDPKTLQDVHADVAVVLRVAGAGAAIRGFLPPPVVFWAQDHHQEPSVKPLGIPGERDAYAGFAMVSNWQCGHYQRHFNIDPARMAILRNAVGPCFQGLFQADEPILGHKPWPPVLAYVSTPNRGLDLLLDVFPAIRAQIPGTRLRVHSSMKVYQWPDEIDAQAHGHLYRRCQQMEGVEYAGSVSQTELARSLKSVTALAYPNTFPETSCISVMEAMAAGCLVVTTDFAALPETTAGFAHLVPRNADMETYKRQFTQALVGALRQRQSADAAALEAKLRQQVHHTATWCTWDRRAREWLVWLETLRQSRDPFTARHGAEGWSF